MDSPEKILDDFFASKSMTDRQKRAAIETARRFGEQYKSLLRETAMRCNIAFPENDNDRQAFNEGTDHKKCGDFMNRLYQALELK